jgi:phosphate acetyltransferase
MMHLLNDMETIVRSNPQRIVLPEGTEIRTLRAADIVLEKGAAILSLIGNEQEIQELAEKNGLTHISKATIIDPETNSKMGE